MMTLTQMKYVLAVAKEGSFRRAASACHVTQPTLSVQVQKIEEILGATVFERKTSPVRPTRIGKLLIEQLKIAHLEAMKALEIASFEAGIVSGELRIGVIPTVSPYLVPLFLKSLNQASPELQLTISELTTANCLLALDREEIDVAILATKETRAKYRQQVLYDEEMLLFTNREHAFFKRQKVSVNELEAEEIWLLEEGHCLRDEIVKVCHLSRSLKKRPRNLNLKVGNLESVRYLVEANFGYTLLPYLATLKLSPAEKKLLREFSEPKPSRSVNLTTRRNFLRSSAIALLKDEILANLPPGELQGSRRASV